MSQSFRAKKQHILSSLARDNDTYIDLSPKGSVDQGIRGLVNEINQTDGFVTTSSCSGRIALFLEGARIARSGISNSTAELSTSAGGKGGGEWLFTSHEPVDLSALAKPGELLAHLGLPPNATTSFPTLSEPVQYLHFKFEPMILHILTSTATHAQKALAAALTAGFRESGISSPVDSPMLAVRTSGLAIDSLIGFAAAHSPEIHLMVSEDYLRTLVGVANEWFEINRLRTERFRAAFLQLCATDEREVERKFEPADVRRERMRREGLQKREALFADTNANATVPDERLGGEPYFDADDSYDFEILLAETDDAEKQGS